MEENWKYNTPESLGYDSNAMSQNLGQEEMFKINNFSLSQQPINRVEHIKYEGMEESPVSAMKGQK